MIGNPRGATGTGIVRGTGGSITRGDRLICASGHGLTWMGGVPWFDELWKWCETPMVKQPGMRYLYLSRLILRLLDKARKLCKPDVLGISALRNPLFSVQELIELNQGKTNRQD